MIDMNNDGKVDLGEGRITVEKFNEMDEESAKIKKQTQKKGSFFNRIVLMIIFIMGSSILLGGCSSIDYESRLSEQEEEISDLSEQNEEISESVEALLNEMDTLNQSIEDLNSNVEILEERNDKMESFVDELMIENDEEFSILDIRNSGYVVSWTEIGPLLVRIESIEPYLSGYKLELIIGNPLDVTYNGLELELKCMTDYMDNKPIIQSFSVADSIEAGRWNNIDIIVNDVTEKNMAYLKFDFQADNVMLFE